MSWDPSYEHKRFVYLIPKMFLNLAYDNNTPNWEKKSVL